MGEALLALCPVAVPWAQVAGRKTSVGWAVWWRWGDQRCHPCWDGTKAGCWDRWGSQGKRRGVWDVLVCENPWRSFSGDKDNSVSPVPAWGSKERCRMCCVISAPALQQSFDYVHLGDPSFPYLHLSCPVVLESVKVWSLLKHAQSWKKCHETKNHLLSCTTQSKHDCTCETVEHSKQLLSWLLNKEKGRNFRDRIWGWVLKTCKDVVTWCIWFFDTKQIYIYLLPCHFNPFPHCFSSTKTKFQAQKRKKKWSKRSYILLAASKTHFQTFQFFSFFSSSHWHTFDILWVELYFIPWGIGRQSECLLFWDAFQAMVCIAPSQSQLAAMGLADILQGKGHEAPACRSVWRPRCCILRYTKLTIPHSMAEMLTWANYCKLCNTGQADSGTSPGSFTSCMRVHEVSS